MRYDVRLGNDDHASWVDVSWAGVAVNFSTAAAMALVLNLAAGRIFERKARA
jgi:hypothetical protein